MVFPENFCFLEKSFISFRVGPSICMTNTLYPPCSPKNNTFGTPCFIIAGSKRFISIINHQVCGLISTYEVKLQINYLEPPRVDSFGTRFPETQPLDQVERT